MAKDQIKTHSQILLILLQYLPHSKRKEFSYNQGDLTIQCFIFLKDLKY